MSTEPETARQPIRVMYVITALPRGGAEGVLIDLVNNLDRRLFLPMVCVLHSAPLIAEMNADVPALSNILSWAGDMSGLPRLMRVLREERPDIIDVFGRGDAAFWGRFAAKLAGVGCLVHSDHRGQFSLIREPKETLYHLVNLLLDPWTDAFIDVSETQRDFHVRVGLPKDRISVIYNGIDLTRFVDNPENRSRVRDELGISDSIPVIGMVANFSAVKRHDVLLRAFARIRQCIPETLCLLVGDGELLKSTEEMTRRLGISSSVKFLGSRSDIARILSAVDVYVLSSDSESFSKSILEAMAMGKPVVATACGGPSEVVQEGVTGFLVPVGSHTDLAVRVVELLVDTTVARKMGEAGRQRAIECFGLQRMVQAREEKYSQITYGRGSA